MYYWIDGLTKILEKSWKSRTQRGTSFLQYFFVFFLKSSFRDEHDYILSEWKRADTEKKGKLGLKQIIALTNTLNIKFSKKYIKKKFQVLQSLSLY